MEYPRPGIESKLHLQCRHGDQLAIQLKSHIINPLHHCGNNPWPILFFNFIYLFIYLFILLFRAAPLSYGSSQARGWIRAMAISLHHSHSNTRSLTHWVRPGLEPASSWILVGFLTPWATRGTPCWPISKSHLLIQSNSVISEPVFIDSVSSTYVSYFLLLHMPSNFLI